MIVSSDCLRTPHRMHNEGFGTEYVAHLLWGQLARERPESLTAPACKDHAVYGLFSNHRYSISVSSGGGSGSTT
jgi:hypothetical protein